MAYAGTDNQGELTQEQVQAILIKPLEAASVFIAAGPRVFNCTAAGPVRIPKLVSIGEPSWTDENTEITEVDSDFDEVVLLDGIKSLKSITRYSNELARSSIVALDAALRDKMVLDVASKLDAALIAGDGDIVATKQTTPLGIINYAGTSELLAVGVLTIDDLHDAVGVAMANNVNIPNLKWMMRSETFVAVRKIKDLQDRYVLTPDVTQAGKFQLLGFPVIITNRLPNNLGTGTDETAVVLADFSTIAFAKDLFPSVKLLDQTYAAFDQQAIRVVIHADAAPMTPEAVVILRGVTL